MRILVGWDNAEQAELLELYLSVEHTDVHVVQTWADLQTELTNGGWDVLLVTLGGAEHEQEIGRFGQIREAHPDLPIVGACRTDEVYRMAGFLRRGMRSYVVRDEAGDHFFLLHALLEGVLFTPRPAAAKAPEAVDLAPLRAVERASLRAVDLPDGYSVAQVAGRHEGPALAVKRLDGRTAVVLADAADEHQRAAFSTLAAIAAAKNRRPGGILSNIRELASLAGVSVPPMIVMLLDCERHGLAWIATVPSTDSSATTRTGAETMDVDSETLIGGDTLSVRVMRSA